MKSDKKVQKCVNWVSVHVWGRSEPDPEAGTSFVEDFSCSCVCAGAGSDSAAFGTISIRIAQYPRSSLSRSRTWWVGLYVRAGLRRCVSMARVGVMCVVNVEAEMGGGAGLRERGKVERIVSCGS